MISTSLQVYNEMIRDLLCPESGDLELREDSTGVSVAGLTVVCNLFWDLLQFPLDTDPALILLFLPYPDFDFLFTLLAV